MLEVAIDRQSGRNKNPSTRIAIQLLAEDISHVQRRRVQHEAERGHVDPVHRILVVAFTPACQRIDQLSSALLAVFGLLLDRPYPPVFVAIGLLLALALNSSDRTAAVLRAIFFGTSVLSVTIVTIIWKMMYMPGNGAIASVMRYFGMDPIAFTTTASLALPAIAITTITTSSATKNLIINSSTAELMLTD